jgi:hypothetical protein
MSSAQTTRLRILASPNSPAFPIYDTAQKTTNPDLSVIHFRWYVSVELLPSNERPTDKRQTVFAAAETCWPSNEGDGGTQFTKPPLGNGSKETHTSTHIDSWDIRSRSRRWVKGPCETCITSFLKFHSDN